MKNTVFIAMVALLAAAATVQAEPLFSTTGTFSNNSNSLTINDRTLPFPGNSPAVDLGLTTPGQIAIPVSFGTWSYTGDVQNPTLFAGESFTLQITQSDPSSPGLDPQTGFLTGTFIANGATGLSISLTPSIVTSDSAPAYTYTIFQAQAVGNSVNGDGLQLIGSVQRGLGGPAPAPIPLAAVAGTGLFGLVGASRFLRRRAV